jgi:hypothetical protein
MNDWHPGCEPKWFQTTGLRWLNRDGVQILQQRYILQGYGEWPPRAEEWRDVPGVSANG